MRPEITPQEERALVALLLLAFPVLLVLTVRKQRRPPPPPVPPLRLDLNRAPRAALRALPGVGAKTAHRIVLARPLRDLAQVEALLGAKRFARIRPYVVVNPLRVEGPRGPGFRGRSAR